MMLVWAGMALFVSSLAGALMLHASNTAAQNLEFTALDVGQGDAILLRTPSGDNILIDGGPDRSVLSRIGAHIPFWDRTLDLVILTHPHADHVAGLVDVLKRMPVQRVMGTGVVHTTPEYAEFLDSVKAKGVKLEEAQAGTVERFGDVVLTYLAPTHSLAGERVDELNNTSIVVMVQYGKSRFLLTGDAQVPVEEELRAQGVDLTADVLKVGHHGSKDATSDAFLEAVHPRWAVISVGEGNRYGHPSARTLARLQRHGVDVLRTDESGSVTFASDGKAVEVRTERH